jgi:lipoprotein signal peptidase
MLARAALTIGLAVVVAAADLAHKWGNPTPDWAFHVRSGQWVALMAVVVVGCILLARVPSREIALAAGLVAGAAAGNGISALAWGIGVPNPIVIQAPAYVIAFNVADVFAVTGILLLTSLLFALTLARREQLQPARTRGARGDRS